MCKRDSIRKSEQNKQICPLSNVFHPPLPPTPPQEEFSKSTFTLRYDATPEIRDPTPISLRANTKDDKFSQIVASNHLPSYTNFNFETPPFGLPNGTVAMPLFGEGSVDSRVEFKLEASWGEEVTNTLDIGGWNVAKMKAVR